MKFDLKELGLTLYDWLSFMIPGALSLSLLLTLPRMDNVIVQILTSWKGHPIPTPLLDTSILAFLFVTGSYSMGQLVSTVADRLLSWLGEEFYYPSVLLWGEIPPENIQGFDNVRFYIGRLMFGWGYRTFSVPTRDRLKEALLKHSIAMKPEEFEKNISDHRYRRELFDLCFYALDQAKQRPASTSMYIRVDGFYRGLLGIVLMALAVSWHHGNCRAIEACILLAVAIFSRKQVYSTSVAVSVYDAILLIDNPLPPVATTTSSAAQAQPTQ